MKRIVVVASAAVLFGSMLAAPSAHAAEGWSAPGSGVVSISSTLNGGGTIRGNQPRPAGPSQQTVSVGRNPGGYGRGKLIEISLRTQRLTAWQDGRAVMSFKISTGRPGYRTPAGKFKIRAKGTRWWSRKWKVWMPYAMNFYSNYNLHSLPHANGSKRLIGASTLGRPASHGCVRVGPSDAIRLYKWAPVGTPVWIH